MKVEQSVEYSAALMEMSLAAKMAVMKVGMRVDGWALKKVG